MANNNKFWSVIRTLKDVKDVCDLDAERTDLCDTIQQLHIDVGSAPRLVSDHNGVSGSQSIRLPDWVVPQLITVLEERKDEITKILKINYGLEDV